MAWGRGSGSCCAVISVWEDRTFRKRAVATGDNDVTVLKAPDLRIQKQLQRSISRDARFATTYRKRPSGQGVPPPAGHPATGGNAGSWTTVPAGTPF